MPCIGPRTAQRSLTEKQITLDWPHATKRATIDGVKGIPGPPDDSDAAIATNELRMKVSEQLALRDYWSTSD